MSYIKTVWENKPSIKTPLSAENLNHMEDGIVEAHDKLSDYDTYKANSIISEQSSEYIHVTDSANVKLVDMELQGKTEQTQYEGKNLFDVDKASDSNNWVTATKNGYYGFVIQGKPNTTYTVSAKKTQDFEVLYLAIDYYSKYFDEEGNVIANEIEQGFWICANSDFYSPVTFTTDSTGLLLLLLLATTYTKQVVFNEILSDIQIEEGTVTTDYEPYVGGIPSPNPEFPQEIINAGVLNEETGRYEVGCKVAGKNLFDESKLSGGEFVELNGVKCYKYKDNADNFRYTDVFKENTQYTISAMVHRDDSTDGTYITIVYTDGHKEIIMLNNVDTIYTQASIAGRTISGLSGSYNMGQNCYLDLSVMQIEEGTEATEYEPPKQQPFTLTSDRQITKWDKLVKRDGVWGWSYHQLHITAYGDNWYAYDHDVYKGFVNGLLPEFMERRDGYCAQLRIDKKGTIVQNGLWLGANNDYVYAICNDYYDDLLEDKGLSNWNEHLNENPLEIWTYSEEEQEFIPLSDEEQAMMNNLETYYGVTNVYNNQGCPMRIQYVCDTKKHIEQNYASKEECDELKQRVSKMESIIVKS